MKLAFCFVILICLLSCNDSKKETVKTQVVYDMYVPSEMSLLMKALYDHNLKLKNEVLQGQIVTPFQDQFLDIHSAQLSDFKTRTDRFKSFSNVFINAQKEVYNSSSSISLKDRFNNAINACIACHSIECTGPIPKIKKLLITP